MIDRIKDYIKNNTESRVLVDELMKNHTTYGIGGPVDLFVLPSNKEDLIKVFEISKKYNQEVNVVGSGSNLLVSDNGIRGVVICIKNCLNNLDVEDNKIFTACGEELVMRGVNEMFIWSQDKTGVTTLPEIAKTGATWIGPSSKIINTLSGTFVIKESNCFLLKYVPVGLSGFAK